MKRSEGEVSSGSAGETVRGSAAALRTSPFHPESGEQPPGEGEQMSART